MKTFYFVGQDNFGNRGCEALIRSNVKTLKKYFSSSTFLVPSRNIALDSAQWLSASEENVEFIRAEPIPSKIRWWSRARRLLKFLNGFPPSYELTQYTQDKIKRSDAVIMTGGDIISLDYGLESLYYWSCICEYAMEHSIPTVLWGASVGPFNKIPAVENRMKKFLERFSLITVRETSSLEYLKSIGINTAKLVSDSAFVLEPEAAPAECLEIFKGEVPVLGFNVSPLIRKFREGEESKSELDDEVVGFIRDVLNDGNFKVLLIPHVDPLDNNSENSDSTYMQALLEKIMKSGEFANKIAILPRNLNAAQLKDVLRRCAYFMGARTHATVGSISQMVPTTSIAYSIKAKGINKDIFGNTDYVLDTPAVTKSSLSVHFNLLIKNAEQIRAHLAAKLPKIKEESELSAKYLSDIIARHQAAIRA